MAKELKNYVVMILLVIIGIELTSLYFMGKEYDQILNNQQQMSRMESEIKLLSKLLGEAREDVKKEEQRLEKKVAGISLESIDNKLNQILDHSDNITLYQGMHRGQLRTLISKVITYLGENDVDRWTDLLMITAQLESNLGWLVKQQKGPAQGIFQVEPETEKSIWKVFLADNRNPNLANKIRKLRFEANLGLNEMQFNTAYATAMAYCIYKWRKADPSKMSILDLVVTYKKSYNTEKGKARILTSFKKLKGTKLLEK